MAVLIQSAHREAAADLLGASFELRHRILVKRLGWVLPSGDNPREIDAFDDGEASHLISRTSDGRVRGTMRLTPSLMPNLSCDVLQSFVPGRLPRGHHIVECSRLCVDLDQPSAERSAARADLFLSHLELCQQFGWSHTVGILLQSVVQYFLRSGVALDILSPPLRFADRAESSVAFLLDTGAAALATARRVMRNYSALEQLERLQTACAA